MTLRLATTTALAFACAGCLHFDSKPLDPSRRAARLTSRELASKTWTLRALTDEAIANSADIALARAQYATAKAALGTAGERPNPTVAISPQIITPTTSWIANTYGVDFDWTFETADKRARRMDVAHATARVAAAGVIEATWKVRAAVRKAMLDLSAAERKTALLK